MKTLPFVVPSLIAVCLMAAVQTMADEGDACAQDTVEALLMCVEHALDQAPINDAGVEQGLLATLYAAQEAVRRHQYDVAVNMLEAFTHQVEAQDGKSIPEEHAEHMITHAQDVIEALEKLSG